MAQINFGSVNNNPSPSTYSSPGSQISSGVIPARVIDIILDDSHPKFLKYGEWNSIGLVFFTTNIVNPTPQNFNNDLIVDTDPPVAYPLQANTKNYPLINEIIYIMYLPSNELLESPLQRVPYYLPPINIWNSQHHNGIPTAEQATNQNIADDYLNTTDGNFRRITDDSSNVYLGKTFKERINIYPLLPYEGDIIYEGRWGNSVRLGSTVKDANIPNEWSAVGDNGDPITILRNGQGSDPKEPWIPRLEDINKDASSIYLTSTQQLPLLTVSNNNNSFEKSPSSTPTSPSQYRGNQITLNSGRLVFNAKSDSIILSSEKSIHLSSNDMVGIDGANQISISAPTVYLGSAIGVEGLQLQSLVLGENLNQVLSSISTFLNTLGIAFSVATDSVGAPIIALNTIAQDAQTLSKNLTNIINSKDLLSKTVKTV
jgi:hypothetical protein